MKKMLRLMEKAKEKGKILSDSEAEGKKKAVHELMKEMGSGIAKKLGSAKLKKVTVASDSEEGLKEGLEAAEDKVEEMMGKKSEMSCNECGKEDCPMCNESEDESEDEMEGESEEMSLEDIDAQIKKLEALKKLKLEE